MRPENICTIDGPSASGKSTVGLLIAKRLRWDFLDTGRLYRAVALAATGSPQLSFDAGRCPRISCDLKRQIWLLDGLDVTARLDTEDVATVASGLALDGNVRSFCTDWARRVFHDSSVGLVATGRDVGSTIFPTAVAKYYLRVSKPAARRRRGDDAEEALRIARDLRDRDRELSPLRPCVGAFEIDTSDLDIEETVEAVLADLLPRIGSAQQR